MIENFLQSKDDVDECVDVGNIYCSITINIGYFRRISQTENHVNYCVNVGNVYGTIAVEVSNNKFFFNYYTLQVRESLSFINSPSLIEVPSLGNIGRLLLEIS